MIVKFLAPILCVVILSITAGCSNSPGSSSGSSGGNSSVASSSSSSSSSSPVSGSVWTCATTNAGFTPRGGNASIVFNNKMWVIGGNNANTLFNDVWYSSDGTNWNVATTSMGIPGRSAVISVVFNNNIWIIGGAPGTGGGADDVWRSSDGTNWSCATSSAAFPLLIYQTAVVFNGSIWVIGGSTNDQNKGPVTNGVWYSSDGTNWNCATPAADFPARSWHTSLVYNNNIWVIGGFSSSYSNKFSDAWYSADGTNWKKASESLPFGSSGGGAVFNNKIYIIDNGQSRVCYSSDGTNWNIATSSAAFPIRQSLLSLISYNNKMWIIAGGGSNNFYNDVWYSQ